MSNRWLFRWRARLRTEESGQDLLEYALLAGIVGITSLLLFTTVAPRMGDAYSGSNTAQEDAWEPCEPGAGCP